MYYFWQGHLLEFTKNTHILSRMHFIKIALLFTAIVLSFQIKLYAQNKKLFTVVIDAGHGGKDPGNRGNK